MFILDYVRFRPTARQYEAFLIANEQLLLWTYYYSLVLLSQNLAKERSLNLNPGYFYPGFQHGNKHGILAQPIMLSFNLITSSIPSKKVSCSCCELNQ